MARVTSLPIAIFSLSVFGSQIVFATPVYQVFDTDVVWTETVSGSGPIGSGSAIFQAPISAHDGDNEIWEFPVKPGLTLLDLSLPAGDDTMETTDLYHGYQDLKSSRWGVGNCDIGLGGG